jgi:hypothetical protein
MSQAIQRHQSDSISGTFTDAGAVNDRMQWAQQNAHLISPATAVGNMPDGCGIAMSIVTVDVKLDTYSTGGGKFGLSKTVLQKIGHAAGISWDPIASGRLDDGSHPYYVRWRAVGTYRAFDGQVQTLHAEKEFDLRTGSPQIAGKSDRQIAEMRAHAQSHAETKAQLRAIRSLGIKTGYTEEELRQPFVAARIMFTGKSSSPEMQREFSRMTAEAFLGGQRALYGRPANAPLNDTPPAPARLAPPPVGTTTSDDEDDFPASYRETSGEPVRPQPQNSTAAQPAAARSGATIPGGNSKGTPIEEASDRDLEYWSKRISADLTEGKSRNPARDEPLQKAMAAELAKRQGAGPGGDY